jgi:hypothetical protein
MKGCYHRLGAGMLRAPFVISGTDQSWDGQSYILTTARQQPRNSRARSLPRQQTVKSRWQVTSHASYVSREYLETGRKYCIVYLFPSHERSKEPPRQSHPPVHTHLRSTSRASAPSRALHRRDASPARCSLAHNNLPHGHIRAGNRATE